MINKEEKMKGKFREKLIGIFDYTDSKVSISVNVGVALITFIVTKVLGIGGLISLFICVSSILALGAIVQILRKDKSMKMIISYVGGTLFSIFVTIMVLFIKIYSNTNNDVMLANVIKIFISVIALLFDIPGLFFIMNKENEKKKKILILVCMIYFTLIALVVILFFSLKGL